MENVVGLTTVRKQAARIAPELQPLARCILAALASAACFQEQDAAPSLPENVDKGKVARLRAFIVSEIWEPELRSELVDRLTNAVVTRMTDAKTLRAAIKRAKSLKADYDRTGGGKGRDAIWRTLAAWLRGVYESKGIEWRETRAALEPRPESETRALKVITPGTGEVVSVENL